MGNLRIKGKDLKKIGFTSETAKSLAINIITKHFKHSNKDETLKQFESVIDNPSVFIDDPKLGILSHSGSRGFGAEVAKAYTEIAMKQLKIHKGMQHMAWLDLNSQEGSEYWALMNLAGDYAKACHDMIHSSISKALGLTQLLKIENHHNFAWKEVLEDGEQYVVHRKGATPASKGTFGIIPASMSQPGFIVKGLGATDSMNSASHGAGRKLSRSRAKNTITVSELNKHLKQKNITLIGGCVDEAPFVYKDLNKVMMSQKKLVDIEGKFFPKIVRMDKNS